MGEPFTALGIKYISKDYWREIEQEPQIYCELLEEAKFNCLDIEVLYFYGPEQPK